MIAGSYVMLDPGITRLIFVRVTAPGMILTGAALAIGPFLLRRDGSPELAHYVRNLLGGSTVEAPPSSAEV